MNPQLKFVRSKIIEISGKFMVKVMIKLMFNNDEED